MIHDFDDAKEESNKVASKGKHCFKLNTGLKFVAQNPSTKTLTSKPKMTLKMAEVAQAHL